MTRYVALLRGINVGGKNLIRMPALADCVRAQGYDGVRTYIQSGNVVFASPADDPRAVESDLERALLTTFELPIRVLVRSHDQLAATVASAPAFSTDAQMRSDVIFLKHPLSAEEAFAGLPEPREGVDRVAVGPECLYFARVAALATKSRMSRIIGRPSYASMTIRNWRTTTTLLGMLDEAHDGT